MDAVAQALADPIRREILRMLRTRRATAGALAGTFDVTRPAVSRHLRVLREAGLVRDESRGRERLYELDLSPLAPLEAYLSELRVPGAHWQQRFDALETEVHRVRRRNARQPAQPSTNELTNKRATRTRKETA